MKQFLYPRFSLLSLLLLVTLAGVSVSHWLTSRRAARLAGEVAEQQLRIKDFNDDLGNLTIDDPAKVHLIAVDLFQTQQWHGDLPLRLGWKMYRPPETEWRLRWAVGDIPIQGWPKQPAGEWPIDTGIDLECQIRLELSHSPSTGWTVKLAHAEEVATYFIPDAQAGWLKQRVPLAWDCAGEVYGPVGHLMGTDSFSADGSIVLLRCRPASNRAGEVINGPPLPRLRGSGTFGPASPPPLVTNNAPLADGLMIWLASVSEN